MPMGMAPIAPAGLGQAGGNPFARASPYVRPSFGIPPVAGGQAMPPPMPQ